jgi:dipeptidyl aminopeptidase/acylaminoacyl peptidase
MHLPTTDDLRHLKAVSSPQLSPDGKTALFTVTDATADGAKSHVWIVSTSGSDKPRQLTISPPSDKRGEHGAVWSADGNAIYFLAKRGEHTQIFRLDMRGGDAQPFDLKIMPPVDDSKAKDAIPPAGAEKEKTKSDDAKPKEEKPEKTEPLEIDVSGFALSPDGKWVALWAHDPQTPGEKKQKDAKADAEWVDHETHRTRLYLAALKADGAVDGALKPVAVPLDVHGAAWTESGDKLLVSAEQPNNASDLGPAGSTWLVDPSAPGIPTQLKAVPPTAHGAAFTPDGKRIVFAAQTPEDAPPGYADIFALPAAGADEAATKPARLTAGFKGQLSGFGMEFTSEGVPLVDAGIGTHMAPVELLLNGAAAPEPLDLGAPIVANLTTNHARTGWLWLAQGGGMPEKLCYAAKLGNPCTELSIPALAPAGIETVKPQLVTWKSPGADFTVEGLLYLPDAANSGAMPGKVPLVVDVHGGPFGAWEDRDDAFTSFLVAHGWAVLHPNPRGSSNYGVAFAAADKNDLGGGDYQDVMAGVDAVLAKYPIDSTRMALIGYSYGGEMAAFVEGKTDRFKAIVSMAPVIDQFSEYGTENDSWYDRWYFGKPWEHMEDAWKQSPLAGAARAQTPFMLIQGQSDTTDPLGQSEEMYRALRQEGVPVDLVTYPRENHGPLAGGIFGRPSPEPWHGYDARQRIIDFLEKALGAPKM